MYMDTRYSLLQLSRGVNNLNQSHVRRGAYTLILCRCPLMAMNKAHKQPR